jgi:hypothetical protein
VWLQQSLFSDSNRVGRSRRVLPCMHSRWRGRRNRGKKCTEKKKESRIKTNVLVLQRTSRKPSSSRPPVMDLSVSLQVQPTGRGPVTGDRTQSSAVNPDSRRTSETARTPVNVHSLSKG